MRREKDYYSPLDKIIEEVNQDLVTIKRTLRSTSGRVQAKIVSHVVDKLSGVSKVFRAVCESTRRAGSYTDGTQITEPTEFNVHLILRFPFKNKCQVEYGVTQQYGKRTITYCTEYVAVCTVPQPAGENNRRKVNSANSAAHWTYDRLVDERGFLRRDKVLDWWQSIFAQAIPTAPEMVHQVTIDKQNYYMKWSKSESGAKVHVISETGEVRKMDINMVPVLRFQDTDVTTPILSMTRAYNSCLEPDLLKDLPKNWYVFPKPRAENQQDFEDLHWDLSFCKQEKMIMRRKSDLKSINRLLKRFRDNHGWKQLSSQCIKTMILHQVDCRRHGIEELLSRNLGYQFIYFLQVLKDHLRRPALYRYWEWSGELLWGIPHTKMMHGFLDRALKRIDHHIDSKDSAQLRTFVRKLFFGGPAAIVTSCTYHGGRPEVLGSLVFAPSTCSECEQEAKELALSRKSGPDNALLLAGVALGVGILAMIVGKH